MIVLNWKGRKDVIILSTSHKGVVEVKVLWRKKEINIPKTLRKV
jgi:hypothetical protein